MAPKELGDLTGARERLQQSKALGTGTDRQKGRLLGIEWAKSEASYEHLSRLDTMFRDYTGADEFLRLHSDDVVRTVLAIQRACDVDKHVDPETKVSVQGVAPWEPEIDSDSLEGVVGFCEGALAVLEAVGV